jgi:serine/threonine protein kinase/Tfp pilus assembly protein PilF
MSESLTAVPESSLVSLAERVDAVCYRFEKAWRTGKRPRIEDYLVGVADIDRPALLRELVPLDADYRRRAGEQPRRDEYMARFPDLAPDCLTDVSATLTVPDLGPASEPTRAGTAVRYRILRAHARGGLGEVFVAEDQELHREVALKEIVREYAADHRSRSRFLVEGEITGNLEHPGVVPVYGLGTYQDGRPFYAMRFIRGESLKEAIRRFHDSDVPGRDTGERSLAFRQLLRRFIDVCNAVAYAHSRGVIHRDLKPGNVMLGRFGETLVVDWGLAKVGVTDQEASSAKGTEEHGERAVQPRSGSQAEPTQLGAALGTPEYMSPEQASGRHDEVGPASDVYSLGATLHTLLTGRAPAVGAAVGKGRLKAHRGEVSSPRQVKRVVPAALEAICRKAMALRPDDRYFSALSLAADIEHWLADEPVAAYPEPLIQRTRRWLRRHRTLATSAAATLVMGLLLLGGAAVLLNNAREQERRHRIKAEATTEFLATVFHSPDPWRTLSMEEMLDLAATRLNHEFADDAITRGKLQASIAETYQRLGLYVKAAKLGEAIRTIQQESLGADHPDTLTTIHNLAIAYRDSGRLADALTLFEDLLKMRRSRLGAYHADTLVSMHSLAQSYGSAGRLNEAIALHEEVLQLNQATLGSHHPYTLMSINSLAYAYREVGRLADALTLHEQALPLQRATLGPDHPETLSSMNNLASMYRRMDRFAEATTLFEETLTRRKAALGPDHPHTLGTSNNLAVTYRSAGRLAEALSLFEETLKLMKAKHGHDHPDTLTAMVNLAAAYVAMNRLGEAIDLYEETLRLKRAKLGHDHPGTLMAMNHLAYAYRSAGRHLEALTLFEETLKLMRAKLGPEHPSTLTVMPGLAAVYHTTGRVAEALALCEEAFNLRKAKLGPEHSDTLASMSNLASAYQSAGRFEEARTLFLEALRLRRIKLGSEHPHTAASMHDLAGAYRTDGRFEESMRLYQEALAIRRKRLPPDHPELGATLAGLGQCLVQLRQYAEAEEPLREALSIQEKKQSSHWSRFSVQGMVGAALAGQNKFADAESLLVAAYEGLVVREKEMLPTEHERELGQSVDHLIRLYEAWGKPEKAAEWQAKRSDVGRPPNQPELR